MDSLFILIPIALAFVFIAVRIFLWAVKSGQFEDLDTEGKRILFDDQQPSLDTRDAERAKKDPENTPRENT